MRKEFLLPFIFGGLLSTFDAFALNESLTPLSPQEGTTVAENNSSAQTLANENAPHRKLYGFFLGNRNWGLEYGIGELFIDQPGDANLLYPFSDLEALYAGAFADGVYYGASYLYSYSGPPEAGNMIALDLKTGKRKNLGLWTDSKMLRLQDMTYDIKNKIMYACGFESGESILFSVNLENGTLTRVCSLAKTAGTIAADKEGTLYILTPSTILYRVNKTDGSLTELYNFNMGGMELGQSMDFDHTSGKLYWACNTGGAIDYSLIEVTIQNDQVTYEDLGYIGGLNSSSSIKGLYLPYALDGENAPEAPSEVTIIPGKNAELKATIRFKTPAKTFGGDALTDLKSITILRDNEKVAEIPVTETNSDFEWIDQTVPSDKEYRYAIYASNEEGMGQIAYAAQYVGEDIPDRVYSVRIEPTVGCGAVDLRWEKPVNGLNGGYFIESNISYDITRQPGNRIVASGLKECAFTDESIDNLSAYYYEIKAYNAIGGSIYYTPYLIAGPALSVPFTEYFDNSTAVQNVWTCVDNNQDVYTWNINSGLGSYQFGDNSPALEYFIDPYYTSYDINQDADEWVITPPINMAADKNYQFIFRARSMSPETIEIYFGNKNRVDAMEYQGSFNMEGKDGICDFEEYTVDLPVGDGAHCVGIRLTTAFPESRKSFLQIGEASVRENTASNLRENTEPGCFITRGEETVLIHGAFEVAELYNLSGTKLLVSTSGQINTAGLVKGVYMLKVNNGKTSDIFKVIVD